MRVVDAEPPGDGAIVLGTAQDGGVPQAGCGCRACEAARVDPTRARRPSCLGLVDGTTGDRWLIDATPQFPSQLDDLNHLSGESADGPPDGILLTHAHAGHYTGLLHLGREVMCSREVPVWVMPRMRRFLETHQPWASLVQDRNVILKELSADRAVELGASMSVRALPVPHRDEFSETVAFEISGPSRRVLWLPDIDTWDERMPALIQEVDVAWLDGTFFDDGELPGRDVDHIPHPRISHHLEEYASWSEATGTDVRIIHLNHSNPACDPDSPEAGRIAESGVRVAAEGERIEL